MESDSIKMMKKDSIELIGNLLEVDAKKAGSLGFMARPLVQVTLPHRDPGNVPVFARRAGDLRLIIQPLMDDRNGKIINYGIPYGTIPRLVLAWLTTEVVKTKNRQIPLGDSLSSFMRELEMVPTGGRWGTITRLREQVKRLFSSTFSIVYDDKNSFSTAGFKLAQRASFFWDPLHPGQATLFGSFVVLSDEFYREIISHPVPLDTRILRALRASPFAIDLYTWLTYRVSYLQGETVIPWNLLQDQFGSDYAELKTFKFNLVKNLKKILALYPVKVRPTERGLLLIPSTPSVLRK
jgi:hypothetical protein